MKRQLQQLVLLTLLSLAGVAGCVTESTGGLPKPAPKAERAAAQLDVARGYVRAASWVNAKRALAQALEYNPRLPEAYVLYGVVYEAEEEYELAEENYRRALRINSSDSQAIFNFGTFLQRRGRWDDAIEQLHRVVKDTDYRARPEAFEALGLAELARGDKAAARAAFERALTLNTRLAPSVLELAWMSLEEKDLKGALDGYERYRIIGRPTARSLCLGMKIGAAVGNSDQVASSALALKNLFPKSHEAQSCQVLTQ